MPKISALTKEIINSVLHIIFGFALCYAFFPTAELWVLILWCAGIGAVREHIQLLRGHKQLPWIKYVDAGGFVLGAIIFAIIRHHTDIDKLFLR